CKPMIKEKNVFNSHKLFIRNDLVILCYKHLKFKIGSYKNHLSVSAPGAFIGKLNFMENNSRVVGMNLYEVIFTIPIINNCVQFIASCNYRYDKEALKQFSTFLKDTQRIFEDYVQMPPVLFFHNFHIDRIVLLQVSLSNDISSNLENLNRVRLAFRFVGNASSNIVYIVYQLHPYFRSFFFFGKSLIRFIVGRTSC
ncbi:hypothetical protein L9F63_003500, partial [Diploptera punctata]